MTTAAVVAGAAALTAAQQTATLILTNGDRVTGLIAYQGDLAAPHARTFDVQTPDGRRVSIPAGEVAVVDFVGTRPSAAELDALGADTPHVLALRNGNNRAGRLVGLVPGEFLHWENQAGARMTVPLRNVLRVYVSQENALAQFETASNGRKPSGWTSWLERGLLMRPEIVVDASVAWTDTAIDVKRNERVRFTAAGEIRLSRMPGDTAQPAGRDSLRSASAPIPSAPVGALIGRIGDAGTPFPIATETVMPASGRLHLGINDDTITDNSGGYRVTIVRE